MLNNNGKSDPGGAAVAPAEPTSHSSRPLKKGHSDPLDGVSIEVEVNDDIGDYCFVIPAQKRIKDLTPDQQKKYYEDMKARGVDPSSGSENNFADKTILEDGKVIDWTEMIHKPQLKAYKCFRRLPRQYPNNKGLENYEDNLYQFISDYVPHESITRVKYHEVMLEMVKELLTCSQFGAVLTSTRSIDLDEIFIAVKLHDDAIPLTAEFYNYNTPIFQITEPLALEVYKASGAGFYTSPENSAMKTDEEQPLLESSLTRERARTSSSMSSDDGPDSPSKAEMPGLITRTTSQAAINRQLIHKEQVVLQEAEKKR
jgi:hypothetical protein